MSGRSRLASVVGLALLALAGCGEEREPVVLGGTASPTGGMVQRPWGEAPLAPTMRKAEPPTERDVSFARDTLRHHAQGVELSENVLTHPDLDPRVAAAARFIAQDQQREIDQIGSWQTAWSVPRAAHDDHHHHPMPGMVDPALVDRLPGLATGEAQTQFLDLMIEHHRGAITMSQAYLDQPGNAYLGALARHVVTEQAIEIAYLRQLQS